MNLVSDPWSCTGMQKSALSGLDLSVPEVPDDHICLVYNTVSEDTVRPAPVSGIPCKNGF